MGKRVVPVSSTLVVVGAPVAVEGHDGSWRVLSIDAAAQQADVTRLGSSQRVDLRGISLEKLTRR